MRTASIFKHSILTTALLAGLLAPEMAGARSQGRLQRLPGVGLRVDKDLLVTGSNSAVISERCAPGRLDRLGGRVQSIKALPGGQFAVKVQALSGTRFARLGAVADRVKQGSAWFPAKLLWPQAGSESMVRFAKSDRATERFSIGLKAANQANPILRRVEASITVLTGQAGLQWNWADKGAWKSSRNRDRSYYDWTNDKL